MVANNIKERTYLVVLIVLFLLLLMANLFGLRFLGSQSDKWSPEKKDHSHK